MRTICTLMFLALLGSLNGATHLHAQDLRFEHITTADGLSSSSVNAIAQDHEGFLWMSEVARHLADAGYNVPTRKLPDFVMRLIGMFDPSVRALVPNLGRQSLFDTSRIENELNWQSRSLAGSVAETAESLKSLGVVK